MSESPFEVTGVGKWGWLVVAGCVSTEVRVGTSTVVGCPDEDPAGLVGALSRAEEAELCCSVGDSWGRVVTPDIRGELRTLVAVMDASGS